MEIRAAKGKEDIEAICEIASPIWHATYDGIVSEGQTEYMIERFQSVPAVTEQMSTGGYEYYFMVDGDVKCGFLGIVPHKDKADELFLSKLYVKAECAGRGAASAAMEFVKKRASELNVKRVWLTVNKYNKQAIEVYLHKGFVKDFEKQTDIGNGYIMDDYIMALYL